VVVFGWYWWHWRLVGCDVRRVRNSVGAFQRLVGIDSRTIAFVVLPIPIEWHERHTTTKLEDLP
jgi:hypothetical protein